MNSSSTQPHRRFDHPRLVAARSALLWLLVIALAVAPFPWSW